MWKRWLIILGCLGLVAARRFWPEFQVDSLTVWLLVIATVLFVLPEVRTAMPYIKSVKVGEAEVQLRAQVARLGTEIEDAQVTLAKAHPQGRIRHNAPEIERLLDQSCADPRAALLVLSAHLEDFVQRRLQEAELPEGSHYMLLPDAVEGGRSRSESWAVSHSDPASVPTVLAYPQPRRASRGTPGGTRHHFVSGFTWNGTFPVAEHRPATCHACCWE